MKKAILYSLAIYLSMIIILPFASSALTARQRYFKAENAYNVLKKNATKQKYRHNWLNCIEKFQAVYKLTPADSWAPAGMYMSGRLYYELFRISGYSADLKNSIDLLQRIKKRYPKSKYSQKADTFLKNIYKKHSVDESSNSSTNSQNNSSSGSNNSSSTSANNNSSKNNNSSTSGKTSVVKDVRFWSNPTYTRIVIDISNDTTFYHHMLKKDPALNKPQRLYIDLNNSKLEKGFAKIIPVNDNLLTNVRAGQFTPFSVRVVIDIKSFKNYNIFALKEPFRIVIDLEGEGKPINLAAVDTTPETPPFSVKVDPKDIKDQTDLAKQLSLGVGTIVIDPGHGGKDIGAPGRTKNVNEKLITLKLAKILAKKIREKIGCHVILTRTNNTFLTLEGRAAIANTKNADLFISIHTNSSKDKRAYGIETYILGFSKEKESARVAALENKTSEKNIADLENILSSLMQNTKVNESSRLARFVQASTTSGLKKKYKYIRNRGVKQAPFYVLIGARMPSILIETGFISNKRDAGRLNNTVYQNALCDAIAEGIKKYINEINP